MYLYEATVPTFIKLLGNLQLFLEKGAQFASEKKFDVDVLLQARLAPDQFHLTRQVQIACDAAKFCAARLTQRDAPAFEDQEKTLSELRERIEKTIQYLKGFTADDFNGAESRRISQARWESKTLSGSEYVHQVALPNFYFHVTTTYAILRHNGVNLGKADFLGALPLR